MGIAVLGPVTVDAKAGALTPQDRVVLAALAVHPGVQLTRDQLAEAIWGASPPASRTKIIQGCVVRLRKALGAGAIETTPSGYRLLVPRHEIDAQRFESGVERGRSLLAGDEAERAEHVLTEALGLWRGEALAEINDWAAARIEASRLDDLRRSAEELRVEAALRSGRHESVLASAHALVSEAPLRERRWTLLATAQYQAGRQGEALATLRRLRTVLHDELGIDPSHDVDSLERSILLQDPAIGPAAIPPIPSGDCPYPGLRSFGVGDAEEFFGRTADLQSCLRRLAGWPVLAVVGPSGCGKSSLVRAGVAAALLRDGQSVTVVTPGRDPMTVLASLTPRRGATLVVDQCEELFTLCENDAERRSFVERLVGWTTQGQVVLSLRADHVSALSSFPELARLAERGLHLLGPMSEPDLRAAIEGPAVHASLVVEPRLVDVLVAEVSRQPGSLPLMSHALAETWKRREGRTLTLDAYHASGGMHQAVARSAEQVYAQVSDDQKEMLRDLMLRLVLPGPVGEPVRSRLPRRLVVTDAEHDAVVNLLVESRLVTSYDGAVEIAHEALASAWPRLRSWLDDDLEGRRTMHHLASSADAWDTLGRPESELYRGVRLARALHWRDEATPALTSTERDFLGASVELSRAELRQAEKRARHQARANRRLRGLLAAAMVLLLVAGAASLYAVREASGARREATVADAQRVGSRALLTQDIGLSVLLAIAGVRLADTPDTRANLVTQLARFPYLVRSTVAAGGYVDVMDVSRDGSLIAAGDDDNRVHVYDPDGQPVGTFTWGSDPPLLAQSMVAFSPTSDLLAVGSRSIVANPVRLLDPHDMRPTGPSLLVPGGTAGVKDLAFSADGRYLVASTQATGREGATPDFQSPSLAVVWDLRTSTGKPTALVKVGDAPQGIAISPNGQAIYTSLPAAAYDVTSGHLLWRREDASTYFGFDLSRDGSLVALNKADFQASNAVVLLDARSGQTRTVLRGAKDLVRDLRFSNAGNLLAAGTRDGEVILFDVRSAAVADRWPADETVWSIDFSPDDRLIHAGGTSGMLRSWDPGSRSTFLEQVASGGPKRHYIFADLSPDGSRVAYRWQDRAGGGWVRFVDTSTGASTPRVRLSVDEGPWVAGSWSRDGSTYAAHAGCTTPCDYGSTVSVFDPRTGQVTRRRKVVQSEIFAMTHSADDSLLLVSDLSGAITQVDAQSLHPIEATTTKQPSEGAQPSDLPGDGVDCCLKPVPETDRAFYLDGSNDGAYDRWRLIDLTTGTVLRGGDLTLRGVDVAVSPNGRDVAVTGRSGELTRIDLASGDQLHGSTGHTVDLMRVDYSDDGTRIVTGAADGAVSLWDANRLHLLGTVVPPSRGDVVASVGFVGDTHDVIIGSQDGRIFRWRSDPARTLNTGCQMAGRSLTPTEWREYLPAQSYQDVCPQAADTSP